MRKSLCVALLALVAMPAFAADYVQAPGSALAFGGMYQGEPFSGRFPGFDTRLSFDPGDLASARLEVTIPLATATTANADYDGELRGEAFFDSAKFPQAQYRATGFRSLGGNRYAADGTLSLRGVETFDDERKSNLRQIDPTSILKVTDATGATRYEAEQHRAEKRVAPAFA